MQSISTNSTKIALNIHSSLQPGAGIHKADFLNPRVFNIPSCKAFQLVDRNDLLDEVFTEDKEVATFDDLESLREKISYFLIIKKRHKDIVEALILIGSKKP